MASLIYMPSVSEATDTEAESYVESTKSQLVGPAANEGLSPAAKRLCGGGWVERAPERQVRGRGNRSATPPQWASHTWCFTGPWRNSAA